MPFTWPADADTQILQAIRRTSELKFDYQKLAEELTESMGQEVTFTHIKNRLANTRPRAKDGATTTPTKPRTKADKSDSAKATPTPKKDKATPKSTKGTPSKVTPSKRKAVKEEEEEDTAMDGSDSSQEGSLDDPFGMLSDTKDEDDEGPEQGMAAFLAKRRRHINHDEEDDC